MTAAQRLHSAWWQSVVRLLGVFALAVAAGILSENLWLSVALCGAIVIAWHYRRLHRLLRRLYRRQRLLPVEGAGLWDDLEAQLHRRQHASRQRTRRLMTIVRGYRQAASLLPDGALLLDRDGMRLQWFNPQAGRLLGMRSTHLGEPLARWFGAAPRALEWLNSEQTDEPFFDVPCPTDPALRLSLRLIAYSESQWLLIVRDVTKLMKLEQVRRDFVANVSHELRTPLTVMHGYLDIIEPDDYPELAPMLDEMRKQSSRMAQLVEDLLTLSRLEARESLEQRDVVAMRPLLATLRREGEALSAGRHTVTVTQVADIDLLGSTKELHSAFSNLVSNAVRYTPNGGQIDVRFERTNDGGARLAVQDTGYGIPAQHLPRLSERFYRVSSSRARETGGTGLGLSIVKHVLNLHGGHLDITSEVGKGSTFACVFGPNAVAMPEPPHTAFP